MELINQNLTAASILLKKNVATVSYLILYSNDSFKSSFFRLPVLLQKLYGTFFVLPLSPQIKREQPFKTRRRAVSFGRIGYDRT
jgi:hypothetical protein